MRRMNDENRFIMWVILTLFNALLVYCCSNWVLNFGEGILLSILGALIEMGGSLFVWGGKP